MIKVDVGFTVHPRKGYPQRLAYFKECWQALMDQIDSTGCLVRTVVSTETKDVDPRVHAELASFARTSGMTFVENPHRPSLPANFENLLNHCDAPYFFYMQEDWLADEKIELKRDVELLQANPDVNFLRYRWVGSNRFGQELDDRFCRLRLNSQWYYAHNPYLANRPAMEMLRPIPPRESKTNALAKEKKVGVAVRRPSMFKHIGGQSVLTPEKKRPVER